MPPAHSGTLGACPTRQRSPPTSGSLFGGHSSVLSTVVPLTTQRSPSGAGSLFGGHTVSGFDRHSPRSKVLPGGHCGGSDGLPRSSGAAVASTGAAYLLQEQL